ncbi:hypothetical protein BsIDN1_21780 [Bacillus safensis]|uniref:Spore coat protein n=1 Tax=Bacillus safensis TaxID=561879 RepID=A0A5S9M4N7_BACIA|nr:hypothetical protein BsIDN1_21780 [Bacillus safensis]
MSCGKHHGRHDENCVCDAVDKILAEQEAVEDKCPTSCYSNLLSPTVSGKDTIPFFTFLIKRAGCSLLSETSEDSLTIANASNLFSSGLKNYTTAVLRYLY